MFFLKKRGKERGVFAPVGGKIKKLSDVADPVFAAGTMGTGFAVEPNESAVCAPVDGKISTVFPGGHAIGITASDGAEVLVHIGIDTVKRKGDGFSPRIAAGDCVHAGDVLAEVDFAALRAAGFSCDVIVVMTSHGKCRVHDEVMGSPALSGKTRVMSYTV